MQRVREYERKRQFDEFKDRVGEIVNGVVKRTEFGNLMVEIGRAEALLRRDELIPRESFRNGDRVRAYIYDVREEPRGPQIFLSRTHPGFLAKLFAQEVPEIYDGIIEIKRGGARPWQPRQDGGDQPRQLDRSGRRLRRHARLARAGGGAGTAGREDRHHSLEPAGRDLRRQRAGPRRGDEGGMDEEAGRVEVVVPDDQLSLAIGRRGQNVRLASQLTRWDIDILTEAEESERRQEEFRRRTGLFVEALDVDEMFAGLLVTEGFTTVEEIAFTPLEELAAIEGFDEERAAELIRRGRGLPDPPRRRTDRAAPVASASPTRSRRSRAVRRRCWWRLAKKG